MKQHKLLACGLAAGFLVGATVYVLKRLDWFHDDAQDYAIFEAQRN